MSKNSCTIALAIGLAIVPTAMARAQVGGLGDAAMKGATDAVTKDLAERSGLLPSPSPTASPTFASPATTTPTPSPSPTSTASPAGTATPATVEGMGKMMMDRAGQKAMDEAGKKMVPGVP